jgi:hypothetical protein
MLMVNGPQQAAVALVTVRAMPATVRKRKVRGVLPWDFTGDWGFGPQKLGIHPASFGDSEWAPELDGPMFGCQDCYTNMMIYVETGDSTSKHWTPQKSDLNQDKRTGGYPQT